MRPSRDDQEIIRLSLAEIEAIGNWVGIRRESHPDQQLYLIGGWAVYLYNPWLGSVDIDLVAGSRLRNSLSQFLVSERNFARREEDGIKFLMKSTDRGDIIIDFVTTSDPWEFYGTKANLGFSHLTKSNFILSQRIAGAEIVTPNRSLLLIYKLKASWDRTKRVRAGTSARPQWEEEKSVKDGADVLALIDPAAGGTDLDIQFLGEAFKEYSFLQAHLIEICRDRIIISQYGRMDEQKASEVCRKLLSLLGLA